MKPIAKQSSKKAAFTVVELLTVMSIIIILIGLLVPSLNLVKRYAKKVKQKNQFHSISVALDIFNAEDDGYPPSTALPNPGGTNVTTGAQHLAEALVGRDLQGYDPWSSWNTSADDGNPAIYGRSPATRAEINASDDRRMGPYVKLENIGAFQVGELYDNPDNVYDGSAPTAQSPAPVLTDVYRVKRVTLPPPSNKVVKAGSPILYYRADVSSREFDNINPDPSNSIYNSLDNEDLINLGTVMDYTTHHFDQDYTDAAGKTGTQLFYEAITNPQIIQPRPYNQTSYILISAGFDGLYGTNDDVFNFGD